MGSAAPVAADFGGQAAATTAPLAAGASAAVPNPAMGFAGGFPAGGDVLTASAPSFLPGADALAQGGMAAMPMTADPFAPLTAGNWASDGGALALSPGGLPAYGAAAPTAAPPTAQQGLDYINQQFLAQGYAPFNPAEVASYDPSIAKNWDWATKAGTYEPKAPPSFLDQATGALRSPWTQVGLAAAPLAIGLSGIGSQLPASARQAQANYAALAAQGANLNPAQQAVLDQSRQNLTNQWKQTLYNMGRSTGLVPGKGGVPMSTQWPQIAALIDQQVNAQAQQMIQQNIQNALAGNAGLIQLANLQMQEDRNFQQTLQNATKALGLAAGLGGQSKTVTTTTYG